MYFSAYCFWKLCAEFYYSRILIRSGSGLDVVLNFLLKLVCSLIALYKYYACLDYLTADLVGCRRNSAFKNIRKLHDYVFDLEGSYTVARRLNNVVCTSYVPKESVLILPCEVAGMIISVAPRFCRNLGVTLVRIGKSARKSSRYIDTDLSALTRLDRLAL